MSQFAREDFHGDVDFVSDGNITVESDRNQDGAGDIIFRTGGVERARIKHDGSLSGSFFTQYNVKDYGAKGDGVTDDTAAIQAAISAAIATGSTGTGFAGSARVFFPPGNYLVSGSGSTAIFDLSAANKIQFVGSGMEVTVIKRTAGTGAVFYCLGSSGSGKGYMHFEGFTVHGGQTGGHGFDMTYGFGYSRWESVECAYCVDGFKLTGTYESSIMNCVAQLNSGYGFNMNGNNDSTPLVNCYADSNAVAGFRFADGYQGPATNLWANANPINILIEQTAVAPATLHPNINGMVLANLTCEGSDSASPYITTHNIKVTSAAARAIYGLRLTNCLLISGGSTAMLAIDGATGTEIQGLFTYGSPGTAKHVSLAATATNTRIRGWQSVQSGSETLITDAGTGNSHFDPGYLFGETEFNSNVNITATTDATANTIVTAPAVTFDGATPVWIEFYAPAVDPGSGTRIIYVLYDGSSPLDRLGDATYANTNTQVVSLRKKLTPSAGSHTYSIRAYVTSGTGIVKAGAGGASTLAAGLISVTAV